MELSILSNSPALHSLKRQQLIQLCKQYSLKANGKVKSNPTLYWDRVFADVCISITLVRACRT